MSATSLRHNAVEMPTLPRPVIGVLAMVAAVALAVLLWSLVGPLVNRPVSSVRVDGHLTRLKPADIALAADADVDLRLFDADLEELRERIEALPWVASARVSRIWPDTLAVRLVERLPYARWGEGRMIDSNSQIFTPAADEVPAGLPLLSAPPGHEAEAAAVFEDLRARLAGSVFAPSGLALDARGEWRMSNAIGIELRLGQGDPRERLAMILGSVSATLSSQLDKVAYVDLRYSNGFSVGWKDGVAPPAGGRATTVSKTP